MDASPITVTEASRLLTRSSVVRPLGGLDSPQVSQSTGLHGNQTQWLLTGKFG